MGRGVLGGYPDEHNGGGAMSEFNGHYWIDESKPKADSYEEAFRCVREGCLCNSDKMRDRWFDKAGSFLIPKIGRKAFMEIVEESYEKTAGIGNGDELVCADSAGVQSVQSAVDDVYAVDYDALWHGVLH